MKLKAVSSNDVRQEQSFYIAVIEGCNHYLVPNL